MVHRCPLMRFSIIWRYSAIFEKQRWIEHTFTINHQQTLFSSRATPSLSISLSLPALVSYLNDIIIMQAQDKDKKIADLRGLLSQAKAKIEQYKAQLLQRRQGEQSRRQYEKRIKLLEGDSQNIIQQYEERLLRYQKMIEEADHTADTQRKSLANATRTHEELLKRIQALQLIAGKVFALPGKEKETSDAVEELCEIEKCKEFAESLEGLSAGTDTEALGKLVLLLTKNNQLNLTRRRDQRIAFLKRETQLAKAVEEERSRAKMLQTEIQALRKELSDVRDRHQRQIEAMAINKQKLQEEKTNEEFVKQLLMKVILGPKDAALMALGILGKVLKFNEEELKQCEKKLK